MVKRGEEFAGTTASTAAPAEKRDKLSVPMGSGGVKHYLRRWRQEQCSDCKAITEGTCQATPRDVLGCFFLGQRLVYGAPPEAEVA